MSSLKQAIVAAIHKVSGVNPARNIEGEVTAEQARDDFIALLLAELFPENPTVPPVKTKKTKKVVDESSPASTPGRKPGPMTEEKKAAMLAKRKATTEAKKATVPVAEPVAEAVAEPVAEAVAEPVAEAEPVAAPAPKERKKPAEKTPEEKAAIAAKRKATLEAKKSAPTTPETPVTELPVLPASPPSAPTKAKKAAPAPAGDLNLDKFTPTQKKKLLEIAGESVDKKDVLAYLNGLSNAGYNDKKLEDHFRDYVASTAPAAPPKVEEEKVETELLVIDFEGLTYVVNPETKRVYTMDENQNTTPVGYVGMAKFADMEIPEDDE